MLLQFRNMFLSLRSGLRFDIKGNERFLYGLCVGESGYLFSSRSDSHLSSRCPLRNEVRVEQCLHINKDYRDIVILNIAIWYYNFLRRKHNHSSPWAHR